MHDEGIDTSSALGNSHLKWTIMLQPAIFQDGVLIKLSRVNMIWLPDSALVEGSAADVRQLLAANVKV
ncbi:MAG: YcxB family protein [Steroidobacteraceae bacterium]